MSSAFLSAVTVQLSAFLQYFCILGGQKEDEKLEWLVEGKEVV